MESTSRWSRALRRQRRSASPRAAMRRSRSVMAVSSKRARSRQTVSRLGTTPPRQPHEECIGRPALQPEDAIFTDGRRVDQQPHLCRHRIDHQRPALQAREAARQIAIDALLAQERPECGQATAAGQTLVAPGDANAPRVWAPNLLPKVKVPVAALAAERGASHLMDARGGRGLHSWSFAATTTTSLKFQPSVRFLRRST